MKNFPKGGLIGKTVTLAQAVGKFRVPVHAAHACYFIILAVFPTLLLLLGLLRYTGLDVQSLVDILDGFIPDALMDSAERLIVNTYRNTTGTVLSISALTALWSASRGIYGLLVGLNAIYGIRETRGYFRTRLICSAYTLAFLLMLLLAVVMLSVLLMIVVLLLWCRFLILRRLLQRNCNSFGLPYRLCILL